MFDRRSFKATLTRLGYPEDVRFTSRRVSFEDLARGSSIFVKVDAAIRFEDWDELAAGARAAGGILSES